MIRKAIPASLLFVSELALAANTLTPPRGDLLCVQLSKNLSTGNVATETSLTKETLLLQKFLVSHGYLGTIPTGFYGRLTESAVKAYQKKEGLPITGTVGPKTRESITKKDCVVDAAKDFVSKEIAFATSSVKVDNTSSQEDSTVSEFSWYFQGKKYELKLPLSESLYTSYRKSPKVFTYKGDLPQNWTERYNTMFLTIKSDDYTFDALATALLSLARKERLSSNETVGLAMAFVQSIPYDFSKDLKKDHTQYPYETLYTKKGVCADKTFLAYHLVKRLGYGVAILQYLDRNHQALGIKCSSGDDVHGSGYCYAETTNYLPIGFIPTSFGASGETSTSVSNNLDSLFDEKRLGKADIFLKTEGKSYTGVSGTKEKVKRLSSLEEEMNAAKISIAKATEDLSKKQTELSGMRANIEASIKNNNASEYKDLVSSYNKLVTDYQSMYKSYATLVAVYNTDIKEYNEILSTLTGGGK